MPPRARHARPARIRDVAEAAGVSMSTVSNFFNQPERLSAATTARVRTVIDTLDYVPHPGASGLRLGRSSLIGVVVPDVTNSFYASIVRGAGDAAIEHGFSLVLCNSDDDAARELEYFSMLVAQRAAGVVVAPLGADPERLDRLRRRGIPLVLTDRTAPSDSECSVGVDDVAGGRLAIQQLLASGARDIAVVNGDWSIRQCVDRLRGAMQALESVRGATIRQLVVSAMTVADGVQAAEGLIGEPPDGVFCINDFLAVGVCRTLVRAGLRIPEDVSVVGYGDLDIAAFAKVPLTTIRQPIAELGHAAVNLLVEDLESPDQHQHQARIFEPELVLRTSTRTTSRV